MTNICCIDFDGTIVDFAYPDIGAPKPGVKEALQELKKMGFKIHIHSCRTSKELNPLQYDKTQHLIKMMKFFKKNDIPYDKIITEVDKPIARYYIDDKGIEFTNWNDVINKIKSKEEQNEKS